MQHNNMVGSCLALTSDHIRFTRYSVWNLTLLTYCVNQHIYVYLQNVECRWHHKPV